MKIFLHLFLVLSILFFGCKHEPIDYKNPNDNIIVLKYLQDTFELDRGFNHQITPVVLEGIKPFQFSISSVPSVNESLLSIDSLGVISISGFIEEGNYDVSIDVSNNNTEFVFKNIITLTIKKMVMVPSNMSFVPNELIVDFGSEGNSVVPFIKGTYPIDYSVKSEPEIAGFTIGNNGKIYVSNTVPVGVYKLSITASNQIGTTVFNNIYTVDVKKSGPKNLIYTPSSLSIVSGTAGVSPIPTIEGHGDITYQISSTPATPYIYVDNNTGVIFASSSTDIGNYYIDVIATSVYGNTLFYNAFNVNVTSAPVAPNNLSYNPTGISVEFGASGTSASPSITGTTPITYSATVSPVNSAISIHPTNGIISVSNTSTSGTFLLSVTATNTAGSQLFNNIFSVTVNNPTSPSNLVYNPSSISMIEGNSVSSATPTISGSMPITFSLSTTPPTPHITISNSTGVISISNAASAGTYTASVTATNDFGSETFNNIYSILIETPSSFVSFADDILPILNASCTSCHSTFSNYNTAKSKINTIIDRINRVQGSTGFMPKNGTKLPQNQLDLIQQWLDDGLNP
jgi:hypothetical protein